MLTVAEILHGDYAAIAQAAGFDSVTQYELWKAIWSTLADRNPHELVWTLERHDPLRGALLPWTFVSNHDVTRIASQVGLKGARVATAALMTIPGMPAIYYGDELGATGVKEERIGGDDAIRPALPEQPALLSGESAETYRLAQLSIQIRRTHPWLVDGACGVTQWDDQRLTWRTTGSDGQWVESMLTVGSEPSVRISDATGELLVV
jgi:glycosidase